MFIVRFVVSVIVAITKCKLESIDMLSESLKNVLGSVKKKSIM